MVVASGVAIVLPAPPADADGTPDISLSKSASGSVLVGEPITYTLTVTNPAGAVPAFNLSLRDVLPAGLSYVPGSTTPTDLGDPIGYAISRRRVRASCGRPGPTRARWQVGERPSPPRPIVR